MKKLSTLFLLAVLMLPMAALAQDDAAMQEGMADESAAMSADLADDARKARILSNLQFHIPQLAQVSPSIGSIEATDIDGLQEGTLIINGQPRTFLVTADDTKFWLLASEPLDVSRDKGEIDAEMARQEAERVDRLAAEIEGEPVRGNPDAAVTIIEYSDFQCPYCARGFETVEELLAKYPEDVKFVFKHFPLVQIHPWARPAAIASECAANQSGDAFWALHDAYFANQGELNPDNVVSKSKEYLAESEIDMAAWETCASDTASETYQAAAAKVDADLAAGQELGVSGTPGFFVNGQFLNGAQPITAFEPIIEAATGGDDAGSAPSE
jgi:protein-disulfide isomerase